MRFRVFLRFDEKSKNYRILKIYENLLDIINIRPRVQAISQKVLDGKFLGFHTKIEQLKVCKVVFSFELLKNYKKLQTFLESYEMIKT